MSLTAWNYSWLMTGYSWVVTGYSWAVTFVSALTVPTTIIAIIVAYVAWQQWQTAQSKLKLDLFDRRLAVYQQTRDFLTSHMVFGKLEPAEIAKFQIETRVSKWLFNPPICRRPGKPAGTKGYARRLLELGA